MAGRREREKKKLLHENRELVCGNTNNFSGMYKSRSEVCCVADTCVFFKLGLC